MRYNFEVSNSGAQQFMTTSYVPSAQPAPRTAADLKKEAMRAIAAWQEQLKRETNEEAALNTALADLASKITDKAEADRIDAAIRQEWRERKAKEEEESKEK